MNPCQPPLQIEQWVSLVLALASHRSQNEGHRHFGARLMTYAFDDIPAQYADDDTASCYLRQVLVEVAWAVRGFSNVRDHFAKRAFATDAIAREKQSQAKRWLGHSPLHSTSLVGKGIATAIGAGAVAAFPTLFPKTPLPWIVVIGVGTAFAVHGAIEWIVGARVSALLNSLPGATLDEWTKEAQPRYENIVRIFVQKIAAIEQTHYRETAKPDSAAVDDIVARSFAFGFQTLEPALPGIGKDENKSPTVIGSETDV